MLGKGKVGCSFVTESTYMLRNITKNVRFLHLEGLYVKKH
ncbi:hypothetical protein MAHJHV51_50340 [Mycobacterium avium subsp. hominissuis]